MMIYEAVDAGEEPLKVKWWKGKHGNKKTLYISPKGDEPHNPRCWKMRIAPLTTKISHDSIQDHLNALVLEGIIIIRRRDMCCNVSAKNH